PARIPRLDATEDVGRETDCLPGARYGPVLRRGWLLFFARPVPAPALLRYGPRVRQATRPFPPPDASPPSPAAGRVRTASRSPEWPQCDHAWRRVSRETGRGAMPLDPPVILPSGLRASCTRTPNTRGTDRRRPTCPSQRCTTPCALPGPRPARATRAGKTNMQ